MKYVQNGCTLYKINPKCAWLCIKLLNAMHATNSLNLNFIYPNSWWEGLSQQVMPVHLFPCSMLPSSGTKEGSKTNVLQKNRMSKKHFHMVYSSIFHHNISHWAKTQTYIYSNPIHKNVINQIVRAVLQVSRKGFKSCQLIWNSQYFHIR